MSEFIYEIAQSQVEMDPMTADEEVFDSLSSLFGTLSHPVRLRILSLLRESAMDVSHLQDKLEISQSSVSQHLQVLKRHNLIQEKRQGKHMIYSIRSSKVFPVVMNAIQLLMVNAIANSDALSDYADLLNFWA